MKGISVYRPACRTPPAAAFIDSLEPRLREKLLRQLITLPGTPPSALREPHYKHFAIEKYRDLYELRERGKLIVRVIFTYRTDGQILLLHGFVKQQSRDTLRALEQSLRALADLREHPEYAVEYKIKEEETA